MLSRIVLRAGEISVDILKKYIVRFKQLRSLELSIEVVTSDFTLCEVVGTLPFLASFTLIIYPLALAPANPNSRNGGPKYFEALESLCVTGSFFLIQHLLGFIDSPCLKSIEVYHRVINREDEDHVTPFIMVVASKWSQSLKNLLISSASSESSRMTHPSRTAISKCLMLLTDFHEMQTFSLMCWEMEITDDDVRRLVMSWPKLRTLNV
jgi:hypothetical protein